MHNYYDDILLKINEKPQWFDEYAVPRFCKFEPDKCADIYAKEVCLFEIECQACGYAFNVCKSWHHYLKDILLDKPYKTLKQQIEEDKYVGYGDPPNIGCCPAGPTMQSLTVKILEFWSKINNPKSKLEWERLQELEFKINEDIKYMDY